MSINHRLSISGGFNRIAPVNPFIVLTVSNLILVGVLGVEPRTSSLSGTRSNQLSYTPEFPKKWLSLRSRSSGVPSGTALFRGPRSPSVRAASLYSRLRVRYFFRFNNPVSPTANHILLNMVELTGIEPVTYSLQSYRSSQLSYSPRFSGLTRSFLLHF